ncbi:hypothetical protein K7X08_006757 [Anisodus acutangulus]|uniref:Uncharacterized protein n=1 Tax=Anisodus acutangulus TaxID=402998 RepID=A0A9Q1RSZ6_9SOLA|nr:hypothetical protein K7X08_006757 [Anisodus acutangulus]
MHAILGRGKVADLLLWRDKSLTVAILIGFTVIWELRATVGSSWEGIKGVEDITNVGFWDGISKEKATSTHTDNYGAGCGAGCGAACGA